MVFILRYLVVGPICLLPVISMAGVPGVSEILDRYAHNRAQMECVAISSDSWIHHEDSNEGGQWLHRAEEYRRDDKGRLQLVMKIWRNLKAQGEETTPEWANTKELIWDGAQSYSYDAYGSAIGRGRRIPGMLNLHKDAQEVPKVYASAYPGAVLDGVLIGDLEPVRDILTKGDARVRATTDLVNGNACYVIESVSANGRHTVWFDPERGYSIVKAEVRKDGDDLLAGVPVSRSIGPMAKRQPSAPQGRQTRFALSLTDVRLVKEGDAWIPTEAGYRVEYAHSDGRTITDTYHHKRTQILVRPDFEAIGAFRPKFPNGTQVFSPEFGVVKFMWEDGRPVPVVDDSTVRDIDKTIAQERSGRAVPLAGQIVALPSRRDGSTTIHPAASIGNRRSWLVWWWLGGTIVAVTLVLLMIVRAKTRGAPHAH